jgi:hypothetical protein
VFGPHRRELKGYRFRFDDDIKAVVQWFQQQPRESLWREYIDWCINWMLASAWLGIFFNSLCVFTQINPWTGFDLTILIL